MEVSGEAHLRKLQTDFAPHAGCFCVAQTILVCVVTSSKGQDAAAGIRTLASLRPERRS